MKMSRDTNITVVPIVIGCPIRVLNSLCNVLLADRSKIFFLLGKIQYRGVRKNKIMRELIQLNEIPHRAEGSKLENKFVIIFSL